MMALRRPPAVTVAAAAGLVLIFAIAAAASLRIASGKTPFEIRARTIDRFSPFSDQTRFGALTFIGGLDLYSSDPRFSGLSGIVLNADGRAARIVSDRGHLFDGRLDYGADGRPNGFAVKGHTELRADAFQGLARREGEDDITLDAEDIAGTGGEILISVERRPDAAVIGMIRGAGDGRIRTTRRIPVPAEALALDYNRGIEAIAVAPGSSGHAGRILAIAERPSGAEYVWTPAWFLGGSRFEIRRRGFDITAARFLPDGDLVTLERRYTPARGVGMRLRRFAAHDLIAGARLDGEVLIEAGMASQIDNMEGLAVHVDRGRTVLTLVSDNNANILQRTLILQFALEPASGG